MALAGFAVHGGDAPALRKEVAGIAARAAAQIERAPFVAEHRYCTLNQPPVRPIFGGLEELRPGQIHVSLWLTYEKSVRVD